MLVMSKGALSVGQAETYYQEKYSEDDYYTESHRVTGEWYGRGAETLGLSGVVSEEDFRAVLRGTRPGTGEVLVSAATGRDERRAGWDATFNASKSVSIQALVGDDSRLVDAHRRAVERFLELEEFAQARRHRGQEWVTTANIVAARFDHIAKALAPIDLDRIETPPHCVRAERHVGDYDVGVEVWIGAVTISCTDLRWACGNVVEAGGHDVGRG